MKIVKFIIGMLLACSLQGASIGLVSYDFTGAKGDEVSWGPSSVDSSVTASNFERGIGLTSSTAANEFAARSWTEGNAIDWTDFFTFSFAPTGGPVDPTSLSFDFKVSGTGPENIEVRGMFDGTEYPLWSGTTSTSGSTYSFALITPEVVTGGSINIYAYNASSSVGTARIDNVVLSGILPSVQSRIPPGQGVPDGGQTWVLIFSAGVPFCFLFRKRS